MADHGSGWVDKGSLKSHKLLGCGLRYNWFQSLTIFGHTGSDKHAR